MTACAMAHLWLSYTRMFRLGIVLMFIGQVLAPLASSAEISTTAQTENSEASSAATVPAPAQSGLAPADFTRALLTETNRVRRKHGRRPLSSRSELNAAADDQAAFMALTLQVQHESVLPGQATPADRVRRHTVAEVFVAENVAMASLANQPEEFSAARIAATLVDQWFNSPPHRENLLSPRATHFGSSVRLVRHLGHWRAYGVQLFAVDPRTTRRH
jgi:uncharacterized protein YkwD